jgi:DNA-binding transcriptional LysR family regulator
LIGQGFDAAIGGGFELPQGVVAQVAPAHRVLVASADYLQKHEAIAEPDDLQRHDGILIRSPQTGRALLADQQRQSALSALDPEDANDHERLRSRLRHGSAGAGDRAGQHAVCRGVSGGWHIAALPDWYIDDGNISIYYAEHKLLPGKTRAFVDFVIEQFAEQGWRRFSAV